MSALPSIAAAAGAMSLALLGAQMLYVVLPSRLEVAGVGVAALGLVLSANRFISPFTPSPAGERGRGGEGDFNQALETTTTKTANRHPGGAAA